MERIVVFIVKVAVSLFLQGVCQQQNVLFDFMTVKEHLHFYAGLKEVEADERDDMVNMFSFFLTDN